ncbi:hypothetical protein ACI6PS_02910 [Flavobacterium sp. PLA-1-15]|uniref:hypothetical protein n=1 Tax=Flavobacterium sp. PLA-1-15 TaxID=3380533 RepID=UPI003B7F5D73
MRSILLKFRLLIIFIFLFVWSFLVESPFQKGGMDQNMHYMIYFLTVIIAYLFLVPQSYPKFIVAEKILYSFLISIIALIIGGSGTGSLLELLYGSDYEFKSDAIISNLIFYFLTTFTSFGLVQVVIMIKNRNSA